MALVYTEITKLHNCILYNPLKPPFTWPLSAYMILNSIIIIIIIITVKKCLVFLQV